MPILDSLASGLRGLGMTLSPGVFQAGVSEDQQQRQIDEQRRNTVLAQVIKGIESGAIQQSQAAPVLTQMGIPANIIGQSPQTQIALEQLSRERMLRKTLDDLHAGGIPPTPEQIKQVYFKYAEPKEALSALSKNPMEGLPELVKLQTIGAQYRAAGASAAADQIEAQIKKITSTETAETQENINYILGVREKYMKGAATSQEIEKARFIYQRMTAPQVTAQGVITPQYGQEFDPHRGFGVPSNQADEYALQQVRKATAEGKPMTAFVPGVVGNVPIEQPARPQPTVTMTSPQKAKQVIDLSQDLEKAGLPVINSTLGKVETLLQKTPSLAEYVSGPKSMLPDILVSPQIREGRQAINRLFNITLHDRSGAAVTKNELTRLQQEFGAGAFKTNEQLNNAIQQMREIISDHYRGIASGYGGDAIASYNANLEQIGGKPILSTDPAPKGLTQDLWNVMTAAEKQLWNKK